MFGGVNMGKLAIGVFFFSSLALADDVSQNTQLSSRYVSVTTSGATVRPICDSPFKNCKEVLPAIHSDVFKTITQRVEEMYQGKVINPFPSSASDAFLTGALTQTPICNLANRVVYPRGGNTAMPETTGNHEGEKCGLTNCEFACVTDENKGITCQSKDAVNCQKERAWTRGILIQTIWSKFDEVMGELDNKSLNIGAKCVAPLKDASTNNLIASLSSQIDGWNKTNANRPIACDPDASPTKANGEALAVGQPVMAGCSLISTKTLLEKVIAYSAVCETFSRAETQWLQNKDLYGKIP
jgi:hypothetical protein